MSLSLDYLDPAGLPDAATAPHILGMAGFGAGLPSGLPVGTPFVSIAASPVGSEGVCETWMGEGPVARASRGDWQFSQDGRHLLCMIQVAAGEGDLAPLAQRLYAELFALVQDQGYPHLLRVFNYLPRITAVEGGEERYRRFNLGRHEAFAASGHPVSEAPAACALGVLDERLTLYAIAARDPGMPLENPRQISAYRYPGRYGPRSPTFSRALIAEDAAGSMLFVSGTASIVAHESRHAGVATSQLDETLRNIKALLDEGRRRGHAFDPSALRLKAYLRHPEDRGMVEQGLAAAGLSHGLVVLQAEICRPELLLEIEGYARGHRLPEAPASA
jgi:chorismate lyase/3-hydroxybenzoate synthase